jgi:hypothetical protein
MALRDHALRASDRRLNFSRPLLPGSQCILGLSHCLPDVSFFFLCTAEAQAKSPGTLRRPFATAIIAELRCVGCLAAVVHRDVPTTAFPDGSRIRRSIHACVSVEQV